jgi:hypothetical protein
MRHRCTNIIVVVAAVVSSRSVVATGLLLVMLMCLSGSVAHNNDAVGVMGFQIGVCDAADEVLLPSLSRREVATSAARGTPHAAATTTTTSPRAVATWVGDDGSSSLYNHRDHRMMKAATTSVPSRNDGDVDGFGGVLLGGDVETEAECGHPHRPKHHRPEDGEQHLPDAAASSSRTVTSTNNNHHNEDDVTVRLPPTPFASSPPSSLARVGGPRSVATPPARIDVLGRRCPFGSRTVITATSTTLATLRGIEWWPPTTATTTVAHHGVVVVARPDVGGGDDVAGVTAFPHRDDVDDGGEGETLECGTAGSDVFYYHPETVQHVLSTSTILMVNLARFFSTGQRTKLMLILLRRITSAWSIRGGSPSSWLVAVSRVDCRDEGCVAALV